MATVREHLQGILQQAYDAFNRRNIDEVLLLMNADVHWPNGWEGGYVQGHEAVKNYWTRQWKELNPVVAPLSFTENADGQIEVLVHQVVKEVNGNLLFDGMVKHVYTFDKEKIERMEIKIP